MDDCNKSPYFCLRSESVEASSSSVPSTAAVPLASSTSTSTSQQQPERSPYFSTAGQDSAEPQTTRLVTVWPILTVRLYTNFEKI